jgi:hypothetical protein
MSQANRVSQGYGLLGTDRDLYTDVLRYDELIKSVLFFDIQNLPGADITSVNVGAGLVNLVPDVYLGVKAELKYAGSNGTATTESVDEDLIINNSNVITGKSSLTTSTQNYTDYFGFEGGLIAGIMKMIGVKYTASLTSEKQNGFLNNSGTTSNGTNTSVYDAAGALLSSSVTRYGSKVYDKSEFNNYIEAGVDLGPFNAKISFDIKDKASNYTSAKETFSTSANAGYAAYTPANAVSGTASAINNLSAYAWEDYLVYNSTDKMSLVPGVELGGKIDIDDKLVFRPGLSWEMTLDLFNAPYNGVDGTAATVAGYATSYHTIGYTPVLTVNGLTQTTTADSRYFKTTETAPMTNAFSLPLQLNWKPSAGFEAAVKYTPSLYFSHNQTVVNESTRTITTVNDGTGATGLGSSVTTQNVVKAESTELTDTITFGHLFNVAGSFYLVPEKLKVNVGAVVSQSLVSQTTTTKSYTGLNTDTTTVVYSNNTASPVVTSATQDMSANPDSTGTTTLGATSVYGDWNAGLSFFFDENLSLDMGLKTAGTGDIFNVGSWVFQFNIRL